MKKIALKRLTRSDLTFFIWHFQNSNSGNQKAINLNADVFVGKLFPSIADEALRRGDRFPIDLDILGPGETNALNLQRKIVKGDSYKNWRLNGEFVRDEEQRFQPLQEGDLAVIEFEGDIAPYAARLVLVAKGMVADSTVYGQLDAWLGSQRMAQITPSELNTIVNASSLSDTHPLNGINLQDDLEDAAQGGVGAVRRLTKRSTRKVSKTELRAARNQAEENGAIGEELVNEWLSDKRTSGTVETFEWVARDSAIAPYDFTVTPNGGTLERLDVKATSGPFRNTLHISINELLHCADASIPYRIYRVFGIDERKAKLRVSEPLAKFAKEIVSILEKLPVGVMADSVAVDPTLLQFGPEIELQLSPDSTE